MKNSDIYLKNPENRKLVNEGVATVNDENSSQALSVLRYELETFVCDGQYEKGMAHILETYLKNIEQAQQPAVWVSGFYGSGKSHLLKMLRALWLDTVFEDGASARGISDLPQNISDLLKELTTQGKRHGGLHAASGTLGSGASGSVRLALLRIIFKSLDLPEHYHVSRFVMWLKKDGIYDSVKNEVIQNGHEWEEELLNFYVAEGLHDAIVKIKPNLFISTTACVDTLNNLYPFVQDISSDDMIRAIREALTKDGKFPLTLIVLDEVQQYIGDDSQRSIDVQEVVEACSKNFGGKLLFIGSGQTAVTGTSNLKKLEGRFTIRVELSDSDVEAVIRKVILAKKPEAIQPIDQIMQANLGEISRHLSGSTIDHRQEDIKFFPQDYPILPVRRRFWENTLRILDQTCTDSQLRNQLSMVHKVIQTNLESPVGHVVPADYLYFDSVEKLLQARILPRKVYEKTVSWNKGTDDEKLKARACGLVFLINKLVSNNKEIGIKCTIDTLADLLVENLTEGSSGLRSRLPSLLDNCELLMKVHDEYRIQTEESSAWNDEFLGQKSILANEAHRIEDERDTRIRSRFGEIVKKLPLNQGVSNVSRDISTIFDSKLPEDCLRKICVWVRDGWNSDESSVRTDALQAGSSSPVIFVFIPKRSADDLRRSLIDFKSALATLGNRGTPNTPEGTEAKAAMETTKQVAESKIRELINEAFAGARVFQGGGSEILGNDLQEIITEAAGKSLKRLYPNFDIADNPGWAKVYEKAQKGAPDALKAVGDDGEPQKNQICKSILTCIAGGKKGADIRNHFESPPYGWPRDAVDGGLYVLLIAGLIKAIDERNKPVDPKELERKSIGKTLFKVESANVTTAQRIQIRKVFQALGINIKQGEESAHVSDFLAKLNDLAEKSGGEAPKPQKPDISILDEIRRTGGNEQLLLIHNSKDELLKNIELWKSIKEKIDGRWPNWIELKSLADQANGIKDADVLISQVNTIKQQRQLIEDSDLIAPLASGLAQLIREELNRLNTSYIEQHEKGMQRINADQNWKQLEPEQKNALLAKQKLTLNDMPVVSLANTDEILKTLRSISLSSFQDRVVSLASRFNNVLVEAAEIMEPEAQFIKMPNRTIRTEDDLVSWMNEVSEKIKAALAKGPVIIN